MASAQYGGQSIAHMDTGLAPYVEASYLKLKEEQKEYGLPDEWVEKKIRKEVYDAMQAFIYQVNTLTTSNGQTPFISISFGLGTSKFERMITECYLEVHKEGLGGNKVTPVFPKVIFMLQEGINLNPGNPNYDLKKLSINCSIERIYPDYVSVPLNKQVTGSKSVPVTPMGCRSFLSYHEVDGREQYDGRFNMGVVSINLPMVAVESLKEERNFFENLDNYMDLAFKAHMVRVSRLKGTKARQNPLLFMYGAIARLQADDVIDPLFYGGYASISIGFIGLAETVEILGKDRDFGLEVMRYMKEKINSYKEQTGLGFSLYGTPSEGYALRAATCLRKYSEGTIDREYLTNSFHVPVWEQKNPIEKWESEVGYATYCSGGHIGYVEQPQLKHNPEAYESLVNYAYTKLPYFGINTPVDRCFKCGFDGEFNATAEGYTCPSCGNSEEGTISVIRRISGYLTAPNSRPANRGKQQEIMQRVKHK